MRICIGGTFSPLHKGHKVLIKKALETAGTEGSVFIGITTGENLVKKRDVKSFKERKKTMEQFLLEERFKGHVRIEPIYDKYGPSVEEDFDAIIVSPETLHAAEEINKKRERLHKKPLEIIQIPFVMAADNQPISSSRIKNREIDENGNILKGD